jgi:hypothetical protein
MGAGCAPPGAAPIGARLSTSLRIWSRRPWSTLASSCAAFASALLGLLQRQQRVGLGLLRQLQRLLGLGLQELRLRVGLLVRLLGLVEFLLLFVGGLRDAHRHHLAAPVVLDVLQPSPSRFWIATPVSTALSVGSSTNCSMPVMARTVPSRAW